MSDVAQLSVCDKLLIAAHSLEQRARPPFTAEDLVVAAWREFPQTFGLRGHLDEAGVPLFPDSNRVFAEIMGSKPIRKRGLLVKVGEKLYQLTGLGRATATDLLLRRSNDTQTHPSSAGLAISREIRAELRRLRDSRAAQKVARGEADALTFYDACDFWHITPRSYATELKGRLAQTDGNIQLAARAVGEAGTRMRHGGEVFAQEDLQLIGQTHQLLLSTFEAELATIRKRDDQRVV